MKEEQTRLNATKVAHNVLIFLEKRREWCSVIENAKARGELSMRHVHGDPKTANVMIDDMTNKGTAIIDLDMVKPPRLVRCHLLCPDSATRFVSTFFFRMRQGATARSRGA